MVSHLSSHLVAAMLTAAVMLRVVRYASWRSREQRAKKESDSTPSRGLR